MGNPALSAGEREARRQAALDGAIRVTASWTRWFLVVRSVDLGLASVKVFDNPGKAADAKLAADDGIARLREKGKLGPSVCLFGAPDLGTLVITHPDWFDAADSVTVAYGQAMFERPSVLSGGGDSQ